MIWIISLTAYLTAVTVFCGFSAYLGADRQNMFAAIVLNVIVVGASFLGYMAAL